MLNEGETGRRSPHARKVYHLDIIISKETEKQCPGQVRGRCAHLCKEERWMEEKSTSQRKNTIRHRLVCTCCARRSKLDKDKQPSPEREAYLPGQRKKFKPWSFSVSLYFYTNASNED